MDITLLKTFLEVARLGHFGRAAERVFITQSAVSARIKLLEDTLGAKLFTRKRNNIQLTEAGQRLLKSAETIVNNWDKVRNDLNLASEYKGSVLTAGFVYDLWPIIVRNWVIKARRAYQETLFQLNAFAAPQIMEKLVSGELDFAIVFEPPTVPDLVVRELFSVPLVMVSSEPCSLRESMKNHIQIDWGSAFSTLYEEYLEEIDSSSMYMSNGVMALDYLLAEGGSAFLPEPMTQMYIDSGRLYKVSGAPDFIRYVYFIYRELHPREFILGSLAENCTDWLKKSS